jgi:Asp-tRNA(Asn)/Glu-tRNA(Gln) amidotransferase A subunit family amidase
MPINDEPLTIHAAAAAMRAGTLTPVDLLDQCLARIDRYESLVRAWVVIDRDGARRQAERLTDELKRGQVRGPLHGVPVGVKDIIDVFDLPTGCGSKLWANSFARQDATCVRRLRAAGAVILGKTVTTAYAYLDPPVTRNPWDPTRTPGGSSSGSAAAVACGMCLAALGTQTVGSLTRPASFCGVCSFKPSVGAIPTDGVLPLAPTLDHVGVMARCVTDLALLAEVLLNDPAALSPNGFDGEPPPFVVPGGLFADRAEQAMTNAIDGMRLLVPPNSFERCDWPALAADLPRHLRVILATEAAAYHGDRFRRQPDDYPTKIRELIEEGLHVAPADYLGALEHRTAIQKHLDASIFREGAQLLTPATLGPAPDRSTTGDGLFNGPWSYTGHPTLSLPIGRAENGLPLAVQIVGKGRQDLQDLFASAGWLERRIGFDMRLPPTPDELAYREM